jgi:hypothetical protein
MDCITNRALKSRRLSVLAVVFFVTLLALQPGYSESNPTAPDAASEAGTAPATVFRPFPAFSRLAVGLTLGTFGPGVELATPLSPLTNLRVDASFLNLDLSTGRYGVNYNGTVSIRELRASYDFFPFNGSFRLSAGVAAYNHLNVGGTGTVADNKAIYLNSADYFTSAVSPMLSKVTLAYQNKVAPTFTFGWGNAIPRSGRRFAFPVEIGAAYAGTPQFTLNMTGNACAGAPCTTANPGTPVGSLPGFTTNLNAQRAKIVNDLALARFYPILNCGFTYRF